ncbi:MAG: hypothetical protein ACOYOV_12385 [Bacteroidales bacterium]
MYTTYHLSSAQELSADIVDAIKLAFKSKSIKITVEEDLDATAYLKSSIVNKSLLDQSIAQDKKAEYISVKHEDL